MDLDALEPGIDVESCAELDDLGVDGRPGIADRLDVELPELAVAAGLRPVVAEHRSGLGQLDRLRPGLHPVLDVGARDARRRLWSERPRLAFLGPWGEAEELLLDDVGDLADAALEDLDQLEQRRLDPAIAVAGGEVGGQHAPAASRSRSRAAAGRGCRGAHGRWAWP